MNNFQNEIEEMLKRIKEKGIEVNEEEPKDFKCDLCEDTGVILTGSNTARPCECKKKEARAKRMARLLEFADIPPAFKGLDLSDWTIDSYSSESDRKQAKIIKQIAFNYIKFFNKAKRGLYLHSKTPGSGKTMLSLIIGNEVMRIHEKTVKYTTVTDLMETLKSNFNNKTASNKDILESFSEIDLLILDDIGQESVKVKKDSNVSWAEEMLFSILDKRQDFHKPTIFTSNLPINDLPYSQRLKSRITRMIELPLVFPEEDIRVKNTNEDTEFAKLLLKGLESN